MSNRAPIAVVTAAFALGAAVLSGCGGGQQPTATGTTTPVVAGTTATTGNAPTASASCSLNAPATTAPGDTALSSYTVTGVRAANQDCFDRIVIDLSGTSSVKPGYQARYVSSVVSEGKGEAMPLRGAAFLRVSVGAPAYDKTGNPTYQPANKAEVLDAATLTPLAVVKQVAFAGSFEGMTTFGIGLSAQKPFLVTFLDDGGKPRLVIDIAH